MRIKALTNIPSFIDTNMKQYSALPKGKTQSYSKKTGMLLIRKGWGVGFSKNKKIFGTFFPEKL